MKINTDINEDTQATKQVRTLLKTTQLLNLECSGNRHHKNKSLWTACLFMYPHEVLCKFNSDGNNKFSIN